MNDSKNQSEAKTLDDLASTDSGVISVPEAGQLLGLRRAASYAAARRGDIPTIKIGRRVVVPKAALRALLGMSTGVSEAAE